LRYQSDWILPQDAKVQFKAKKLQAKASAEGGVSAGGFLKWGYCPKNAGWFISWKIRTENG